MPTTLKMCSQTSPRSPGNSIFQRCLLRGGREMARSLPQRPHLRATATFHRWSITVFRPLPSNSALQRRQVFAGSPARQTSNRPWGCRRSCAARGQICQCQARLQPARYPRVAPPSRMSSDRFQWCPAVSARRPVSSRRRQQRVAAMKTAIRPSLGRGRSVVALDVSMAEARPMPTLPSSVHAVTAATGRSPWA